MSRPFLIILEGGVNRIFTAIIGYAEFVKADLQRADRPTNDISQVLEAGRRAAELVRRILAFNRQGEQSPQPLRVQYIVNEALKLLRSTIPTTIEIRQNIDKECGAVMADPIQIHQVIMNLCTNANQAMGSSAGRLEISLGQVTLEAGDPVLQQGIKPGGYVLLTVSDTGCGMDRQTLERIFDPYFSTKKERGGTGLGLAMVHSIVTGLGGAIGVDSEPGQGATFRVYMPLLSEQPESRAESPEGKEELPTGEERLLVVDDERPLVEIMKRLLEALGYRVTGCVGSVEALAVFTERPEDFDLIVTDFAMPCMNGVELARQVLAQRPELPIVLLTGYADPAMIEEAKAAGVRECLVKPASIANLAETIRRVLGS